MRLCCAPLLSHRNKGSDSLFSCKGNEPDAATMPQPVMGAPRICHTGNDTKREWLIHLFLSAPLPSKCKTTGGHNHHHPVCPPNWLPAWGCGTHHWCPMERKAGQENGRKAEEKVRMVIFILSIAQLFCFSLIEDV